MEVVGPVVTLLDWLSRRPELAYAAAMTVLWWLERTERKDQTKINLDLQKLMLDALSEVKDAVSQGNLLLQILTRGRGS